MVAEGHPILEPAVRFISRRPALILPFERLRHPDLAFQRSTELVIEGYPRSANTFAVLAFESAQRHPIRIAHHLHVSAQVIAAVRHGVPCMVIIREPEDAIVSFLLRDRTISPAIALRRYVDFYSSLIPFRSGFVVVPFQEVVTSFGTSIDRLNLTFGTHFGRFEATEASTQAIFRQAYQLEAGHPAEFETRVGRPSRTRERQGLPLRARLEAADLRPLLRETMHICEQFLSANL